MLQSELDSAAKMATIEQKHIPYVTRGFVGRVEEVDVGGKGRKKRGGGILAKPERRRERT